MMLLNPICHTETNAAFACFTHQWADKKTAKTDIHEKACRILQFTFRYASDIRDRLLAQHAGIQNIFFL